MFPILHQLIVCGCWAALLGFVDNQDASPDDEVRSVTVRVTLAEDGGDLNEPLGLDLGLGFPLWLRPLDHSDSEVRWGVLPREAPQSFERGTPATFVFDPEASASAGTEGSQQDAVPLHEARNTAVRKQLFDDVRVADISRVAWLAPHGAGDWKLRDYAIEVNGVLFDEKEDVGQGPASARDSARQEISAQTLANTEGAEEIESLRELAEADFATEEELQRLAQLEEENREFAARLERLQKIVDGEGPWLVSDFASPWRNRTGVERAEVKVVTADGLGTETDNFVYLQLGGRKLLLSAPDKPLTAEEGLQNFVIDLSDSPLTAEDLRGAGLGMIAHGRPQTLDQARWKVERLLVQLGERYVYDSHDHQLDSRSLAAVSLAPTHHVNSQLEVEAASLTEKIVSLWRSGHGQGLQSDSIAASTVQPTGVGDGGAGDDLGSSQGLSDGGEGPWQSGGDDQLAGDDFSNQDGQDGDTTGDPQNSFGDATPLGGNPMPWGASGQNPLDNDPFGQGSLAPNPFGTGSAGGTMSPDLLAQNPNTGSAGLGQAWWPQQPAPTPMPNPLPAPQPAGDPPQVSNVEIEGPVQVGQAFTVKWEAHNEQTLGSYQITVFEAHPDRPAFQGDWLSVLATASESVGIHETTITIDQASCEMIYVEVVGVPTDTTMNLTPTQQSPLAVLLPRNANGTTAGILMPEFLHGDDVTNLTSEDIPDAAPTSGRGVWPVDVGESHLGVSFASASSHQNIAWRAADENELIRTVVAYEISGKSRLVGQLGFLNGVAANNSIDVDVSIHVMPANGEPGTKESLAFLQDAAKTTAQLSTANQGNYLPTGKLDHPIDFDGIDKRRWIVLVSLTARGGSIDPQHPPVLFGLHMRPLQ